MPDFSFIQITDHHLLESEEQLREGFAPGYALRMVMRHIHKGVQFVFIDWGPESKAVFPPATREFLSQALQSELPSVIVCHQQVKPLGIWEKVLGILCGHVQITYEDEYKGIQILGLRSTAFTFAESDEFQIILAPPHYLFVSIQNNILTSRIYKVLI